MRAPSLLAAVAVVLGLFAAGASGEEPDDLFDLPLEELVAVPVVSVTGRAHDWFTTPAAVHVISGDELRRSGHTSLVEMLRIEDELGPLARYAGGSKLAGQSV